MNIKEVSVQELKRMRDEGIDFQLIDVREPAEFAAANLGGELMPVGNILQFHDKIATDKPVIVHCRSGMRSANAIATLQQFFQFQNLHNLKGGIMAYSAEIDPSLKVS